MFILGDEMKKFFKNKPRAWFFIGLFIITLITVTASIWLILTKEDNQAKEGLLAKVGDREITETDLNRRIFGFNSFVGSIDNPGNIDTDAKQPIFKELIEWRLLDIKAAEDNINVSESEITDYSRDNIENYLDMTGDIKSVVDENTYYEILQNKLTDEYVLKASGNFIIARFDAKRVTDNSNNVDISDDKEYAEKLINEVYQDIKSKKITFEEGMKVVDNDKRIGLSAFGNNSIIHSDYFTASNLTLNNSVFTYEEAREKVTTMETNSFSTPFIVSADFDDGEADEIQPIAYVMLEVKSTNNKNFENYESFLDSILKNNPVEVFSDEFIDFNTVLTRRLNTAHAISAPFNYTTEKPYLGVNTGSSSSSAGIVMGAYKKTSAGEYWLGSTSNPDSMRIRVTQVAKTGSSGPSILCCGAYPSDYGDTKDFGLGAKIYKNYPDSYIARVGTSVLGYGISSHWGNRYTLDCSWNYNFRPLDTPSIDPNHETGAWQWAINHDPSINDSDSKWTNGTSVTTYVTNGGTRWVMFRYNVTWSNNAPVTTPSLPARDQVFDPDDTITFQTVATDSNNDRVEHLVAYIQVDELGNNIGSYTYLNSGLVSSSTSPAAVGTASGLTEGRYKWIIAAQDEHGLYNAIPSGSPNYYSHNDPWYFTVEDQVVSEPSLSCTVTPESGLAPLVISVEVFSNNIDSPSYNFDMENDGIDEYSGRTTNIVYYTYETRGTYTIKVTETTSNLTALCTPGDVRVGAPSDSDGGEVAP